MAGTGRVAGALSFVSVGDTKRTLAPNTVEVSWTIGGTTYTLTDDGAGNLTGDGSGTVSYSNGLLFLNPNPAPKPDDGDFNIDYEEWSGTTLQTDSVSLVVTPGSDTVFAPSEAMKAGSIRIEVAVQRIKTQHRYLDGTPADKTVYYIANLLLTDDGNGNLRAENGGSVLGTVNYATGEINFNARDTYSYKVYQEKALLGSGTFWENQTDTATETYGGSSANITWAAGADPQATLSVTRPVPGLLIDVAPNTFRSVVPNSLIFELGGKRYFDRDGAIITDWDPTTDAGSNVGSIDYPNGLVTLNDYPANTPTTTPVTLIACLTTLNQAPTQYTVFRTAGAPLREGSLIVNATDIEGTQHTLNAETSGDITGGPAGTTGTVDTQTGLVIINWGEAVDPSTIRYSAVSYTYLPLDSGLVGLDATRLPSDGRVPQFNLADVIVISNTQTHVENSVTAGQVVNFGRVNQANVYVEGDNGNRLDPAQYTLDTDAGTLTFEDPLSLVDTEANAVTEPLTIHERVEDMALATDVQIGGQIGLNIALSQDYPAGDTLVSAAVLYGDIRARAYNAFHQKTWNSVWEDERSGDDTTAKYNIVSYPIEMTNQGAIKERWAIRFTSSTSFEVIGETVGIVASGNVTTDCAPTNAATGAPYFTIKADGWGAGWVSGNTLRFNTDGGQAPFWVARTIVAGRATEEEDQFATQNRGDAD